MTDSVKRDTNIEALKDRVPLSALIGRTHQLTRNGREAVAVCPFHQDRKASLTINDDKGFYHCFPCGAHGDHVDWLKEVDGLSFFGARDRLMELAGVQREDVDKLPPAKPRKTPEELAAERAKKIDAGLKRWRWTRPAAGTQVETYLTQGRKLNLGLIGLSNRVRFGVVDYWWTPPKGEDRAAPPPPPVCLGRWPAMVIALQDAPGLPDFSDLSKPHGLVGVHVTWLADDGSDKRFIPHPLTGEAMNPRKMFGVSRGAGMRLYPPAETMALSEGFETGMSARQAGWRDIAPGKLSVWAAGSLDNIAGRSVDEGERHPRRPRAKLRGIVPDPDDTGMLLPPECKRVLLIRDNDNGDPEMAESIYRLVSIRWRSEGREVWHVTPPLGADLNDVAKWEAERDDG
ncbi:hypothetical protein VZ95_02910 [Elstera litoralis]|uniref:Zinc finger CHC2-type domain-containing protein n=1 Tax=Elstera litoralis TaxID=552518 RepID=A0A0F3IYT5_9PROT|nr:CHC2 zinc finger domain-containing protein [Elstera litoralis]KJV10759.1 hypothetical protein VZ95_02910 [Elstera litoralis]